MIRSLILVIILFFSVLFEASFLSFPFVLICAIALYAFSENVFSLFVILFATLLLDALNVNPLGITTMVVFSLLLILSIYQRVLEIRDYRFFIILVAIFTLFYAHFASYQLSGSLYLGLVVGTVTTLFLLTRRGRSHSSFEGESIAKEVFAQNIKH